MFKSAKKAVKPRDGFRHWVKKGSSKMIGKFLAGGALVSGALAAGSAVAHIQGDRAPKRITSDMYVRDESQSMFRLSGIEGGGFHIASIIGVSILVLFSCMVGMPLIRCVYRLSKCGQRRKVIDTEIPASGSFHYKEGISYTNPINPQFHEHQWTDSGFIDPPQPHPVYPAHQMQIPHSHPVPHPHLAWDEIDIAEDPAEEEVQMEVN